jgi:hypothetical protein
MGGVVRNKLEEKIEAGRLRDGYYGSDPGAMYGAFAVMGPCGRTLRIISSGPDAWEHVSVSLEGKNPPNWQEMSWVKEKFWEDEETVLQFHPKKSEYKNLHPNCLHLWRNEGLDHPLPDQELV